MIRAFASRVLLGSAAALIAALPAVAQDSAAGDSGRLTGTLKKIKDSGVVVVGHRVNSPPFSFLDPRGQPVGYSLDLCAALVDDIADELGVAALRVEHVAVTPENRFAMVASGQVDIECGSTTHNAERERQVAFSTTIFVTGTKLLVRADGPLRSIADLRGRTVAVTRGTTNAAAVQAWSDHQGLALTLLAGADHAEAYALLADGRADALANDEVLLHGLIAQSRSDRWRVAGDFLSYEPYALMFRRGDRAFADVVARGFNRLAASREIVWIYDKWFLKRLPSGLRLNLPMSPQLRELWRVAGLPDD